MDKLQLIIKITQFFNICNCTYNETDEILSNVQQHYRTIREQKEYDTVNDFIKGNKSRDIGDETVSALPL